ncbi:MAG: RIP metalloprotease RseP [Peptococcaceae bacterium]|nr:RIP metalloprotease RseP [Peptococcaceae bacterium]
MTTAIIAILIFALLVSVHEFGHFITAKLSGMYVEEFSIGMGPQLISKRIGETRYTLRALPLGGFVRVLGEDIAEEERSGVEAVHVPEERRYQNRPVWQRMIFAAAGSFMNMVSAVVIFAIMFLVLGVAVPIEHPDTTISALVENGPAYSAGVEPGDKFVAIDGRPVETWEEMNSIIMAASTEDILNVTVERQNEEDGIERFDVQIQPMMSEDGSRVLLGIYGQTAERQAVGPIRAMGLGFITTWETTVMMVDVLGDLFTGQINIMDDEEGLTGPVGIVQIIDESAKAGWVYVFNLAALLSINLGVINLLPIPALDGCKLIFLLYEALRGKPVAPEKEGMLNMIGFMLLMGLILVVTYKDIMRLLMP